MSDEQNESLPEPAPMPPEAPPSADLSPAALKTAYNAFKKRWKLTRLDYESRIGKSPLSSGAHNTIVGIAAPREYPKAVWEELVKQGRLKHAGSGLYSMP
ncbi:MAG TPA: hypothetical protein VHU84_08405 [Lacipirellulaceae bacterium]|nr:hypothetical protein [Lacipirellulaceae bacterium]